MLQGYFKPTNPMKYKGNPANIVYRSGWEFKLMKYLDTHADVLEWSSEEIRIPYRSLIDGQRHTYFPDFYVKFRDQSGKVKVIVIEVKPAVQTKPPTKKEKSRKYIKEVVTYGVNVSKWRAATEYCKDRGWEFRLMTEEHVPEWSM